MARIDQTFPSLDKSNLTDVVTVFDNVSEFVDAVQAINLPCHSSADKWSGGEHISAVTRKCRTGDLARVASSDDFMKQFEELIGYAGSKFRNVNDVMGQTLNFGNYLAGNPVCLRNRKRVMDEQAPLNIVVDCVSSGGIDAKDLEKRGAAILALVRILSATRPVSLYIAAAALPYQDKGTLTSVSVAARLDSAPIDLARAAHLLCAVGVSRQMAYGYIMSHGGKRGDAGSLAWSYSSNEFQRKNGKRYWQRALGMGEMLYVAAPYISDDIISDPAKWLKGMIAEYGQPEKD